MLEMIGLEILKKIVPEIVKSTGGGVKQTYQKLKSSISNACHRYDERYRERHGEVKVFCAEMREPIPLDDVYVAVQFLDQHIASRYRSLEEVERAFRERDRHHFDSTSDERQDGTQTANDKQYLMLLGGPGIGKSTFLRKVGLEALKGKDGSFKHQCLPVFLELKRFKEDEIDIKALIIHEFKICGYPYPEQVVNAALKSGKLLILFDGLDEVPRANVHNVILKIGDFVDQYSQNRFIASCRIAAYKGEFRKFKEVEVADFDDIQIQRYIKNWFDSTPDERRRQLHNDMETAERCWRMLQASDHLATKELARNPLLLTLLCMVYDRSQTLPRNRVGLYEKALNVFLEEWAAEKVVHRGASMNQYLDITGEKRMLSEIAAKNFEENRLFFSKGELITQIQEFGEGNANTLETFNASKILDTILIDQGLLVERVRNSYSFSHLTFQEYLTANYIVGHPQSIQGLVEGHLQDEQWREIFLLTAGLMREADDLLESMEAEAAKLINTPRLKALFQWVERITDTSNDRDNRIARRSFALYQYFSLHLLNEIYGVVEDIVNHDIDRDRYHHLYRYLDLYLDLDLYLYRYQDRYQDRYLYRYQDRYQDRYLYLDRDLYGYLYRYQDRYRDLYRDLYRYHHLYPNRYLDLYRDRDLYLYLYLDRYLGFYQDFYRYMDAEFYPLVFDEFGNRFDEELQERVTLIKRMEQMKIFKGADLQQMVRRFNAQREFIGMAGRGGSIKPPAESIHDTWLSVLGVTDEMLALSDEELDNCRQYLRAVDLIVACKEAAGYVSPDVWQRIEDRFLTVDAEEPEEVSVIEDSQ